MPKLAVRKSEEVPLPSHATKAVREQQELYEGFVREIGVDVGQLDLSTGESARGASGVGVGDGLGVGSELGVCVVVLKVSEAFA